MSVFSALAATVLTGKPAPCAASCVCTGSLPRYCRKSAHAFDARVVQAKPSPPPSTAAGSPAPPGTDGNGNQPTLESSCLSSVSADIVPGSQSPCSSIAALPLATRPAELPAPCWAAVPANPVWNGCVARKFFRSCPAFVQHGSSSLIAFTDCLSTSTEHSRTAK